MYQPFVLLVIGLLATVSAPDSEPRTTTAPKPVAAAKKPATKAAARPAAVSAAAARTQRFLQRVNLAPLLRFNPASGTAGVMNGFYSYDYWRLEVVLTAVQRDAKNPGLYHVRGKSRRHRKVTPLSGTIRFTEVALLPRPSASDLPYQPWQPATVSGSFTLQETGGRRGTFSGDIDVDVAPDPERKVRVWCCAADNETRGGGILFEGQWRLGAERVPVIWKDDIFSLARNILTDFEIGSRDVEINRKYSRRGWDTYWENEEWWAERPVARR
ncbi:hypothetical protein [Hymenobacter sp. B81]|uniref:hypothetical protein n=1 Tax=Hymenobacter sp. B81 TaxID=3344878 RepID=UPI0037DC9258